MRAAYLAAGISFFSSLVFAENESRTQSMQSQAPEEVIVTAQKQSQRLLDVPVPVSVVSAESLVETNQLRIQDYYTKIPGLSVMPGEGGSFAGLPKLTIRGFTTGGFSVPTVGVTVDDVPYGSSKGLGLLAPDIDPSDLARVEVLRGPQGALYGASSMGGLFKYVTVDPSTERLSGRLQGGMSSVSNGEEPGYSVRGAVNVPVNSEFAFRASAFTRRDPGYIDDPSLGVDGVNRTDASGARLSALWRASEDWSVKVSALVQDISADGSMFVHRLPGLGEFEQTAVRNTGGYDRKSQAFSAIVTGRIGAAELTSVTGYNFDEMSNALDFTSIFGPLAQGMYGVAGAFFQEQAETSKISQELRVSMPLSERVDWLIGAFYTAEDSDYDWDLLAADPNVGANAGFMGRSVGPTTYSEYALFTNVTFHITERFDLQIGGRESRGRQDYKSTTSGPLFGDVTTLDPGSITEEDAFTYLITPQFKFSPDVMVYARLASGFRAGGSNPDPFSLGIPRKFDPDKTENYEIGLKGSVLDRRLTLDASVYYIDWNDIQVQVYAPGTTVAYTTNGSRATSEGLELSLEAAATDSLTLGAWASWNEAALAESLPAQSTVIGSKNDRLPYTSKFSASVTADQQFTLSNNLTGSIGASVSYLSDREGVFTPTGDRQNFPAYATTDLRASLEWESWMLGLFVNNVTDKRAFVSGGTGSIFPFAFIYNQPRTMGMTLTKAF